MRITVITPTLDRRDLLREAVESLARQQHGDLEHIVIDGGSRDGTLEMLAGRPGLTVINDERLGLYAAINLGIARATGEVVGILNSDDLYPPGALAAVERAFERNPDAESVCGAAEVFDGEQVIRRYHTAQELRLDAHTALVGACLTNARFFRRRVFDRVGLFSLEFRRVADREFLARCLRLGLREEILPETVYRYRRHESSLTFGTDTTKTESFRSELLRLAHRLGADPQASATLREKARALEGRCLLTLAGGRIRNLDFGGAWRLLATRDDQLSLGPARAMASGMSDLLVQFQRRS